jgi:predicted dehydrogenase
MHTSINETPNTPNTSRITPRFLEDHRPNRSGFGPGRVAIPHVHAGEDNTPARFGPVVAGAAPAQPNAFATSKLGPIKLVAMADVSRNKLKRSYQALNEKHSSQWMCRRRKFIGFDGYEKAIACLKPGDIAFCHAARIPVGSLKHAIERVNVFMEKPTAGRADRAPHDGPVRDATKKNLKVGVGLMSRRRALQQLHQRIQDGEIGDVMLMRGYRVHGPVGSAFSKKWPGKPSELLWQISRFHSFLWASGGCFSDFYIHHIDHLSWMKNAWPIKARVWRRHYRQSSGGGLYVDQNFDVYSRNTFADGQVHYGWTLHHRLQRHLRELRARQQGMATSRITPTVDCLDTYKGQNPDRSKQIWISEIDTDQQDPYK